MEEAGDLGASIKWYSHAAEQGNVKAQFNLGRRYTLGEGVAKDIKKAVYWYTKSSGTISVKLNLRIGYL
ncbi:hypothetical protein N9M50_03060 [Alphaproteobacteria bacterium]|nr:hypothetical protein [Alphaproteobacteria bacterium]